MKNYKLEKLIESLDKYPCDKCGFFKRLFCVFSCEEFDSYYKKNYETGGKNGKPQTGKYNPKI